MQTVPCCVVLGKSLLEKCPFSHGNQNRSPPDISVFRYWHTFAKAMPESKLLLVDVSETNTLLLWHYRPKVSRPLIARTERRIPLEREGESFQVWEGFLWKPNWVCSGLCDFGAHRVGQEGKKLRAETEQRRHLMQETVSFLLSVSVYLSSLTNDFALYLSNITGSIR